MLHGKLKMGPWKFTARRRAMTVIELLVAVTILVVMILAFATIMSQSQRVVRTSQKTMRSNAAASAIIRTFRDDIRRATQHGLLCITQDPVNLQPYLLVTTAGVIPSKTQAEIGNAGLSCFGLCDNTSTTTRDVLYAQRWVFVQGGSGGDLWGLDLAEVQTYDRAMMNVTVNDVCSYVPGGGSSPDIVIPPQNLTDVGALWQVLADQCQALSIMWTDGTSDATGLNWYGVDYDTLTDTYEIAASVAGWEGRIESDGEIEFSEGVAYRALWTHHNQNLWPKAIKIRFMLLEDDQQNEYEVICPVGGG